MLSPRTIRLYDLLYAITTSLKAVPFGWTRKTSPGPAPLTIYSLQGKARWLAYLNFVMDDIATAINVFGLGHFVLSNYEQPNVIVPGLMHFAATGFIWSLKYCVYLFEHEIVATINSGFRTSEATIKYFTAEAALQRQHKADKVLQISATGFMLITASIPLGVFVLELFDPMNLYSFYFGLNSTGEIAYATFAAVLMYHKLLMLNFMTLTLFAPGPLTKWWFGELMNKAKQLSSSSRPCEVRKLQKLYSSVQLYYRIYEITWCPLILTLYLFGCSFLCIIGSSMLILFSDRLSVFIMIIIADVVFFVVFGFMYGLQMQIDMAIDSQDFLHVIAPRCDTPYLRLVHKSKRHICANYSSMFNVTPGIMLGTFGNIAEQIGSLVIGFKEF